MISNRNAVVEMTIGLLVMAGAVQAASTFINTCPFVITSPGDYLLSADLICGGGSGITIASSNVTLNLEGHRITAGAGASIAIEVNGMTGGAHSSVHIVGPGLITNGGGSAFAFGVVLTGIVSNSEVSGITVLGSSAAGIEIDGFFGNNSGLTFTKTTLGRNGTGISVTNLTSSTISENDVSGNGVGISIDNADVSFSTHLMLRHNIINGNTGNGVNITASGPLIGPPTVTFQSNVISGNGGNGIFAFTGEITNNTSLANGMFDLFDPTSSGCSAEWSGNTFFTANQSCIH